MLQLNYGMKAISVPHYICQDIRITSTAEGGTDPAE